MSGGQEAQEDFLKEVTKEQTEALEKLKSAVTQIACYRLRARRDHPRVMGEIIPRMLDWRGALHNGLHGSPKMNFTIFCFPAGSVSV